MGEVVYKFENKREKVDDDFLTNARFTVYEDKKPVIRVTLDSSSDELGVCRIETVPGYEHSKYKYILFKKILNSIDQINNEFGVIHRRLVNELYDKSEVESYQILSGMNENKALLRLSAMPYVPKDRTH